MFLTIIGNTKPTAKELQDNKIFIDAAPKWFDLGIKLLDNKQLTQLKNIRSDYNDTTVCCREMLLYWLESHTYATWDQLVDALKSPGVELNNVASMVEKFLGLFSEHGLCTMYITLLHTLTNFGVFLPPYCMPAQVHMVHNSMYEQLWNKYMHGYIYTIYQYIA